MKRIFLVALLGLSTVGLFAQDWMKADWYTTKRQVVAKEGQPIKEDEDSLLYTWRLGVMDVPMYYMFEDSMLQMISGRAAKVSFDEGMEFFVENLGRPDGDQSEKAIDFRIFWWKLTNGWLCLSSPFAGTGFVLYLYPSDSNSPLLRQAIQRMAK